jgi:hypothetical protein
MASSLLSPRSRSASSANRYRVNGFDLPLRIPGFGVGFAISKFKQIGVRSKLPPALRAKATDARRTWGA